MSYERSYLSGRSTSTSMGGGGAKKASSSGKSSIAPAAAPVIPHHGQTAQNDELQLSVDWSQQQQQHTQSHRTHLQRPSEVLFLSMALTRNLSGLDQSRLSLVGCSISHLDVLSTPLRIQTLYLSNNNIASLDHVTQFASSLTSLSLANNFLKHLSSLRPLCRLTHLKSLNLQGNVVTEMPFYRPFVLHLLPNLLSLDGLKVSLSLERNATVALTRKVHEFFEQLRHGELRSVVLQHLRGILECHAELRSIVGSPIRFPFFNLQTAINAGVYRWLQISSSDDFDHSAQELAHRAHVQLLQRMTSTLRAKLSHTPALNEEHWTLVVKECLAHQQVQCQGLLEQCAGPDDVSVSKNITALAGLRFVESTASERELLYLRKQQQPKQTMVKKSSTSRVVHFASDAKTSHVQNQYQELLHNLTKAPASSSSSSLAVVDGLTRLLPPQQQEPDALPISKSVKRRALARTQLSSSTSSSAPLSPPRPQKTQVSLDLSSDKVGSFLDRAASSSFPSSKELADNVNAMELLWKVKIPLLDAKTLLTSSANATSNSFRRPEDAKTMQEMKAQIQTAMNDLSQIQRDEYQSWSNADLVLTQFVSARSAILAITERAVVRLNEVQGKTRSVAEDVRVASHWVGMLDDVVQNVEKQKNRLADMKQALEENERKREVYLEKAKQQGEVGANFELEKVEVGLAIAALQKSIKDDKKMVKAVCLHDVNEKLEAGYGKGKLLLARIMRRWKIYTRCSSRQSHFAKRQEVKARRRRLQYFLAAWKGMVAVEKGVRSGERKVIAVVAKRLFSRWLLRAFFSLKSKKSFLPGRMAQQKFALRFWRSIVTKRKNKRRALRLLGKKADLFWFLRCWRAWRKFAHDCQINPKTEELLTEKAEQFAKRFMILYKFSAWLLVTTNQKLERTTCVERVENRSRQKTLCSTFANWNGLFIVSRISRLSAEKRGLLAFRRFAALKRWRGKDVNKRFALSHAFRKSFVWLRHLALLRRFRLRVSLRHRQRTQIRIWAAWRGAWHGKRELNQARQAPGYYEQLRKYFRAWKQARVPLQRKQVDIKQILSFVPPPPPPPASPKNETLLLEKQTRVEMERENKRATDKKLVVAAGFALKAQLRRTMHFFKASVQRRKRTRIAICQVVRRTEHASKHRTFSFLYGRWIGSISLTLRLNDQASIEAELVRRRLGLKIEVERLEQRSQEAEERMFYLAKLSEEREAALSDAQQTLNDVSFSAHVLEREVDEAKKEEERVNNERRVIEALVAMGGGVEDQDAEELSELERRVQEEALQRDFQREILLEVEHNYNVGLDAAERSRAKQQKLEASSRAAYAMCMFFREKIVGLDKQMDEMGRERKALEMRVVELNQALRIGVSTASNVGARQDETLLSLQDEEELLKARQEKASLEEASLRSELEALPKQFATSVTATMQETSRHESLQDSFEFALEAALIYNKEKENLSLLIPSKDEEILPTTKSKKKKSKQHDEAGILALRIRHRLESGDKEKKNSVK